MQLTDFFSTPLLDITATARLLVKFLFNLFFIWVIVHIFYYRRSRKTNYYFTFMLVSISVFFLTYLLGSGGVKIKVGMALGLFAIFGIIRYRTEVISVREMTYLFVIITVSVINALAERMSFSELCAANVLLVAVIWFFEFFSGRKQDACKYILYDRVDHVGTSDYEVLLAEVRERTGLDITSLEVGAINYLQDTVMLKVYYRMPKGRQSSVDRMMKLPAEEE